MVVEVLHPLTPVGVALRYLVKLLLHVSREVIVHDIGEALHQEVVNDTADVSRQQFTLFRAYYLLLTPLRDLVTLECTDGVTPFSALLVAFLYILTLLDSTDGRSIGRRASDAKVFQLLDEACLGVSERWLRETLRCRNLPALKHVALRQRWQYVHGVLFVLLIVGRLAVNLDETVEDDNLTVGDKFLSTVAHVDGNGSLLNLRLCHL